MNSTELRSSVMEYRDHEFRYDAENLHELDEPDSVQQVANGKQYRQQRSARPKRRKSPKASHPGCGIGGRRKRQWNW